MHTDNRADKYDNIAVYMVGYSKGSFNLNIQSNLHLLWVEIMSTKPIYKERFEL
jgi:hypothetical protein